MLGEIVQPKTPEQKRWQAESDARTLAEADVIKADTDRLSLAVAKAKELAEVQKEAAASMAKVAILTYPKSPEMYQK